MCKASNSEEPGAEKPHAGISAGAARQRAVLPRQNPGLRLYNPGIGRWMSRDPIGEEGGASLYVVSRNDLLNRIDRLGLFDVYGHTVFPGHIGILADDNTRYDYGRYRAIYTDSSYSGPNVLIRKNGPPASGDKRKYEIFHFDVCPKLDLKIRAKLESRFSSGSSTIPPAILDRLPEDRRGALADYERYMGTDWSLSDNCVTFTWDVILRAASEMLAEPSTSENSRAQREASQLRLMAADILFGFTTTTPAYVLNKLDAATSRFDWIQRVETGRRQDADKKCCGTGN